jgi:hypothetical protein
MRGALTIITTIVLAYLVHRWLSRPLAVTGAGGAAMDAKNPAIGAGEV